MKLRNKKTGEIKDVESLGHEKSLREKYGPQITLSWDTEYKNLGECRTYKSLAELNEEWEDYEEPTGYWYIDFDGDILGCVEPFDEETDEKRKSIGNYFETEEEAEKAVEKLKAWKRLKDEGFRFCGWANDYKKKMGKILCKCNSRKATFDEAKQFYADLDLLFSGGEDGE